MSLFAMFVYAIHYTLHTKYIGKFERQNFFFLLNNCVMALKKILFVYVRTKYLLFIHIQIHIVIKNLKICTEVN